MRQCFAALLLVVTGCQTAGTPDQTTLDAARAVAGAIEGSPLLMELAYRCADGQEFYGYEKENAFIIEFLDGRTYNLRSSSDHLTYVSGEVSVVLNGEVPTEIHLSYYGLSQKCLYAK